MLPPQANPHAALYGLNGAVHWPTFFARTALYGLLLFPVVRFVGGVGTIRSILTAGVGGIAFTGVQLAWDSGAVLAQIAEGTRPPECAWNHPSACFSGVGQAPQQPIDTQGFTL